MEIAVQDLKFKGNYEVESSSPFFILVNYLQLVVLVLENLTKLNKK
jgi:hypothetical protein